MPSLKTWFVTVIVEREGESAKRYDAKVDRPVRNYSAHLARFPKHRGAKVTWAPTTPDWKTMIGAPRVIEVSDSGNVKYINPTEEKYHSGPDDELPDDTAVEDLLPKPSAALKRSMENRGAKKPLDARFRNGEEAVDNRDSEPNPYQRQQEDAEPGEADRAGSEAADR